MAGSQSVADASGIPPGVAQCTASGRVSSTAAASVRAPLDATGTPLSSVDSDVEHCTLVYDPSGDVQLVCESDPTHPVSLAEDAALRPVLPSSLLQDIEAKLEADIATVLITILFAVGFISLEFGINDLIDHYYGDSVLSDITCVLVGLVVVFWVRISKAKLMRFDRWR